MYVSGLSNATRWPSSRSSASLSVELGPPRRAVPARELVDDHPADVVPVPRVLAARIAEPDDEQVERRGAFAPAPGQDASYPSVVPGSPSADDSPSPSAAPSGRSSPGSSSPSSPSTTSSSGSSTRVGIVKVASTVSGSSSSVAPSGTRRSARRSVSPMTHPADVELEVLGNLHRQRLDVHLSRDLRQRAALPYARRVFRADEHDGDRRGDRLVEADLLQVDVHELAAQRILLVVLENRRMRRRPRRRGRRRGWRASRCRQ